MLLKDIHGIAKFLSRGLYTSNSVDSNEIKIYPDLNFRIEKYLVNVFISPFHQYFHPTQAKFKYYINFQYPVPIAFHYSLSHHPDYNPDHLSIPLTPMPIIKNAERAIFHQQLLNWFDLNQREMPWRNTKDPYCIWVSEVMLQQTQVKTVIPYYKNFIKNYPTVQHLAQADMNGILKSWEGLGYYSRARNLHKAAAQVVSTFNGLIPRDAEQFQTLSGVGDYIKAAVQSIAFNKPISAVDGNVKRVLSRIFMMKSPVNRSSCLKEFCEKADFLLEKSNPGDYNQAMMELGATICKPKNPRCTECPVCQFCAAFHHKATADYPVREKAKKVPEYHIAVGVVKKGDKLLITQRKPDGLLGGLWEFPGGKIEDGETAESACIREIKEETDLTVQIEDILTTVKHAYTHFKIQMKVYLCSYLSGQVHLKGPVDFKWITFDEIGTFPFPKANHKFIPLLASKLDSF